MEKIVIACCGTFLANTRIENVLVEHEIYGPDVVKCVTVWKQLHSWKKSHDSFSRNITTSSTRCFCFFITRCFEGYERGDP